MKEIISPGTPVAGPYSPGVKIGNTLYISGQGWPQASSDIYDQTYNILNNIKKIVITAGGKVSNVVNTTVYLKYMNDFSKMNNAYKKFFEENNVTKDFPARATVEIANFPIPAMLIEISAIVVLD
jgi:2-iminobutanoate/2-iminopropanoate deaminase